MYVTDVGSTHQFVQKLISFLQKSRIKILAQDKTDKLIIKIDLLFFQSAREEMNFYCEFSRISCQKSTILYTSFLGYGRISDNSTKVGIPSILIFFRPFYEEIVNP
jgi:hypothetical protein